MTDPEKVAANPPERPDWDGIARSPSFRRLATAKMRFIVPVFLFFLGYYFCLPVLAGYAPDWMSKRILGAVTFAYGFALSQIVVGWMIAWLYARKAAKFDLMIKDLLKNFAGRREGS